MTGPRGTVFGFEVLSDLDLAYTRSGGGMPLHVTESTTEDPIDPGDLLIEWKPPHHPFGARLYRDGRLYRLWVKGAGWFVIDPLARRIDVPAGCDDIRREERLWGIPALLCFLARGELPLHAAAVEVDGGAVLIAGHSRAGKTTLAAAFARRGFRVLSEDLSCIRMGEQTEVLPGPAMLRLRLDTAARIRISDARVLSADSDRVHLTLDHALRGSGDAVPLRAAFMLRRWNGPTQMQPIDPVHAVSEMWSLSFRVPTDEDRSRCFTQLVDLTQRIPVYELFRTPTHEGLDDLVNAIVSRTPVHV